MISQKYNSFSEIEEEFHTGLLDLLQDSVYDLRLLLEDESTYPLDTSFYYYLFFGQENNSPVGICRFVFHQTQEKQKKFMGLINKSISYKNGEIILPGRIQNGVFFHPKYEKQIQNKVIELIEEFQIRPDIKSLVAYTPFNIKDIVAEVKQFHAGYLKNHLHYQNYFESLPPDTRDQIKNHWSELNKLHIKIGHYNKLRDVFINKSDNLLRYKAIKEEKLVQKYEQSCHSYYTFEDQDKPLMILFYLQSGKNHYFDYIILDETKIPHQMCYELAKMQFFELPQGQKLIPLNPFYDSIENHHLKKTYITKIK